MAVPDFQTLMLPVLEFAVTKDEHSIRDATDYLAIRFKLTEEDKEELIPSGTQPLFYNRVGWARTYLKQAKLLELSHRNYLRITDRGREVLKSKTENINMKYLEQFPEYVEFRDRKSKKRDEIEDVEEIEKLSPGESLDLSYERISDNCVVTRGRGSRRS